MSQSPFDVDAHIELLIKDQKQRDKDHAHAMKEAEAKSVFINAVRNANSNLMAAEYDKLKDDLLIIDKSLQERPSLRDCEGYGAVLNRLRFPRQM